MGGEQDNPAGLSSSPGGQDKPAGICSLYGGEDIQGGVGYPGTGFPRGANQGQVAAGAIVVVVLLFYVHGKHLRSCRDGLLT